MWDLAFRDKGPPSASSAPFLLSCTPTPQGGPSASPSGLLTSCPRAPAESSVSVLSCLRLSDFCLEPKGGRRGIRAYRAKPEHWEPGGEAPLAPSSAWAAPGRIAVPRSPSSPGSSVTRQESAGFNPVGWVDVFTTFLWKNLVVWQRLIHSSLFSIPVPRSQGCLP